MHKGKQHLYYSLQECRDLKKAHCRFHSGHYCKVNVKTPVGECSYWPKGCIKWMFWVFTLKRSHPHNSFLGSTSEILLQRRKKIPPLSLFMSLINVAMTLAVPLQSNWPHSDASAARRFRRSLCGFRDCVIAFEKTRLSPSFCVCSLPFQTSSLPTFVSF